MNQRVAIVGVTGYAGSELAAILGRHPHADLVAAYRASGSAAPAVPFESLHPALAGVDGPPIEPLGLESLLEKQLDCVFLATPNEISAELVPRIHETGARVIDLSGAYRLKEAAAYPSWYGFDHPAPELLAESVYGLPEWCNGELKGAAIVANPGCYSTAILLGLKPLAHRLDRVQPIICDAKSGVSGAGKKSDVDFSFTELAGNFKAYNVTHHRHTPEIRQSLPIPSSTPLVFVPHLLPTARGILVTLHLAFMEPQSDADLYNAFEAAYSGKPFVKLRQPGDLPDLKCVVSTPRAEIGFATLERGRRAVVVAVLDNLLKGASSQAVQNFNRMFGYEEKEGLLA